MSGLIKICGFRDAQRAVVAAEAGADMIGFIFAESRRRVDPEVARDVIRAAKAVKPDLRAVGVFVDAPADEIRQVHDVSGIDIAQVHGYSTVEQLRDFPIPAILALKLKPGEDHVAASSLAKQAADGLAELVFIDGYHPTLAGGTGIRADWSVAESFARSLPLMLAGGLDPECVAEAIATVRPAAVDVSSGVETEGVKDPEKIRAFITNARMGFAQSTSRGTSSQLVP